MFFDRVVVKTILLSRTKSICHPLNKNNLYCNQPRHCDRHKHSDNIDTSRSQDNMENTAEVSQYEHWIIAFRSISKYLEK